MKPRPSTISSAPAATSAEARVAAYDWKALAGELDHYGCAVLSKLPSPEECHTIAGLYPDENHFRSHVIMARHGFGKGEYRYFKYPLPDLLVGLRTALYPHLAGDTRFVDHMPVHVWVNYQREYKRGNVGMTRTESA
jgi:hypothetical protein